MPRKHHDVLDLADHLKLHSFTFVLSPAWRQIRSISKLKWSQIRFEAGNKSKLQKKRGIYAFIVSFEHESFPLHGYVMYVGVTGETRAHRTLYDRFGDYLREKQTGKRLKVLAMLTKFEKDLFFHYAPVDARVNLGSLEEKINGAFIPPVNINDFSATLRKGIRAFIK